MSREIIPDELWSQIDQCAEINEAILILNHLQDLLSRSEVTSDGYKEILRLEAYTFSRLKEFTIEEPDKARAIILDRLLPLCWKDDSEEPIVTHDFRETLAEWVEQYQEDAKNKLRSDVIGRVLAHLESHSSLGACRTIAAIGLRTRKVEDALRVIVENHDDYEGDVALSTLASLGSGDRHFILIELHKRMAIRYNTSLLSTAMSLADPSTINVIYEHWLPMADQEDVDASIKLMPIREILNANSDDVDLQNETWGKLIKLVEDNRIRWFWVFELTDISPNCNSPFVVPTLLRWIAEIPENSDHPEIARYRLNLRLVDCLMPLQLQGWFQGISDKTLESLRGDACQNTKTDGYYPTTESLQKRTAWETLLRAGYNAILEWFNPAVEQEASRFEQGQIMDWLACFRINPLPNAVVHWVTQERDVQGDIDGREFARGFAAVRVARSAATQESFDALLDFGYTHKGQVILQSTEAIAEVALYLSQQDSTAIVTKLLAGLQSNVSRRKRLASADALRVLANHQNVSALIKRHVNDILPMVYEEQRDLLERGALIETLGYLHDWKPSAELELDLRKWSCDPGNWVGGASLFVLASHDLLLQTPDLMASALLLNKTEKYWELDLSGKLPRWLPYYIGLLYQRNPEVFVHAAVTLISQGEWGNVTPLMRWLEITHGVNGEIRLSQDIAKAIVNRVRNRQSASYSETELFGLLARLAPQVLTEERWEDVWDDWMPESRVALANALNKSIGQNSNNDELEECLTKLAVDGVYAVRRAAYRALSNLSMETLRALCEAWVSMGTEYAKRAAEAFGWLEASNEVEKGALSELCARLTTHAEKQVRISVQRSREERRRRTWASEYLRVILNVTGISNQEIFEAWPYAEALAKVGDDSCIEALHDHLKQHNLPPNVHFWIIQIIKKLEQNWRKITQKWPEFWTDLKGALEHGQGRLHMQQGQAQNVSYTICIQPSTTLHEPSSWRGIITAPDILFSLSESEGVLELEDSRRGSILINHRSNSVADFIGTGPYPQQDQIPS